MSVQYECVFMILARSLTDKTLGSWVTYDTVPRRKIIADNSKWLKMRVQWGSVDQFEIVIVMR